MTEDATPTPAPATPTETATPAPVAIDQPMADAPTESRCPWCSALLPSTAVDRCPSCHANLSTESEARMPGLTEVEPPLAGRLRRAEAPKRSKLLSWISGDIDEESTAPIANADPDAIALPPRDVRREMLRLKLEAEGITVTADGQIELPTDPATDTAAPTTAAAPTADAADTAPADESTEPAEDIRKAS
jgi:hypothetical protein